MPARAETELARQVQAVFRIVRIRQLAPLHAGVTAIGRVIGIAAHLGLHVDVPVIGVGKSILCGTHAPPAPGGTANAVPSPADTGGAVSLREWLGPVADPNPTGA